MQRDLEKSLGGKKNKMTQSPAEHNLGAEQGEKQASQSNVDDKESPRETEGKGSYSLPGTRPRDAENQQTQKGDWKTGREKGGLETAEKLLGKSRQDGTCGLASTRLSATTDWGQLRTPRKGDVSQPSWDCGGQGEAPHRRGPWPPKPRPHAGLAGGLLLGE